MNKTSNHAFGRLLRGLREERGLSQTELSKRLGWPQAKVSRVERGGRSVTLPEVLAVAGAFHQSVSGLLGELDLLATGGASLARDAAPGAQALPIGFYSVCADEEALMAQLERFGVRFLGGSRRPALVELTLEEVVLATLRFVSDPRLFEALPALMLKNAPSVDWTRLMSAAYALKLQNRLGMALAAALALEGSAPGVGALAWKSLRSAHDALAEVRLDREEVVGPAPRTEAAREHLRRRTPAWLRFWHGLGSGDLESYRRYLVR